MNTKDAEYFSLPNGRVVYRHELDEDSQKHVAILDKLRKDVAEKSYELHVYMTALEVKKRKLHEILKAFEETDE